MFVIVNGVSIVEVSSAIQYLKKQNGILMISTDSFEYIYSRDSDIKYDATTHKVFDIADADIPDTANIKTDYIYDGTSFIVSDYKKQKDQIDRVTPLASLVVKQNVVAINGDAAEARKLSCSYVADMETLLPIRPWVEGMTTEPGELVYDPDGVNHYMYSGTEKMTHSNPTFYPGASGVYYWSIVPDILNGAKIFPSIDGIVVFVKNGDIWWNPDKTQKYVWTGDEYDCPSNYYPGATGVHQWVAVTEEGT